MDIGIFGAGRLGGTLAQLLVESNHEVATANDSGVEPPENSSETLGPQLRPVEPKQAIRLDDVVFLAIPFRERDSLPDVAWFAEKTVVNTMNPYTEDPHIIDLGGGTLSEFVASQLPDVRLVKLFNIIHWETPRDLGHPDLPESECLAVFLAGDDLDTKACVTGFIHDIGSGPVDVGGLVSGGELLEPGSALYKRETTAEKAQDTVQTLRTQQG